MTPGPITDSIDADDGVIDGFGTAGHSYNQGTSGGGLLTLSFYFDANVLGGFPQNAGVVWTDDRASVTFEAFDSQGFSLGSIGPFILGDVSDAGQTEEDRFFGVFHSAGISQIKISHDGFGMEVDHLQLSSIVPEPTSFALAGLGLLLLVGCRLRRHLR